MKDVEMVNKPYTDFDNHIIIPHKPQSHKKYYVEFNRILHSKKCIYFYIFLILSSVTIFAYSLIAYFLKLDELPIVIIETILIIIITVDMLIRIYVAGCRKYFKKIINILDIFLILMNFFTIFMYLKFHNTAQEIEDISFALLIFIRNSSQLLRLIVLIKNQQSISRNVEEIINFDVLYEEKKMEIMTIKKQSSAHSFVDEDLFKKNTDVMNLSKNHTSYEELGMIE